MAIIPLADDVALRAATDDLIATAPDLLIATTGIGFRGWVEATEEWGLTPALMDQLATTRVISRGPRPPALRAAGLREEWSPESGRASKFSPTCPRNLSGQRVAVRLHGATDDWDPNPGFPCRAAPSRGPMSSASPSTAGPVRRPGPLRSVAGRDRSRPRRRCCVHVGPAVAAMLERAKEVGSYDNLIAALRGPVVPYCVGPVTARPLDDVGVPSVARSGCGWARWPG